MMKNNKARWSTLRFDHNKQLVLPADGYGGEGGQGGHKGQPLSRSEGSFAMHRS